MLSYSLSLVRVVPSFKNRSQGRLLLGFSSFPCALGRAGAGIKKREGDGITPKGVWALRRLHYRADRQRPVPSSFKGRRIRKNDWWSDEPQDRCYNRLVKRRLMPKTSKEGLRREDDLYDFIVEIGYNDRPVKRGRGSGIFLHLARPGFLPTEGCVAVDVKTMRHILRRLQSGARIKIG